MDVQFTFQPQTFDVVTESGKASSQERRIRAALGLTSGPLPEVQTQWLQHYYEYLRGKLAFPFEARYAQDLIGHQPQLSTVTVLELIDPNQHARHEELGLLCRVRRGVDELDVPLADIELAETSPNSQLVEDYWYWFWNWRFDPRI